MIGRIDFTRGGKPASVTLGDDYRLTGEGVSPALLETLQEHIDGERQNYSPSHGRFGVRQLNDLAARLGGRVTLEEKPETPGRVY